MRTPGCRPTAVGSRRRGSARFGALEPYILDVGRDDYYGHSGSWLDVLDNVRPRLKGVARLYPGHGRPGGLDLLDRQRQYLLMYRQSIRTLARGESTISDEAKQDLEAQMTAFLPGAPLTWLVALSADAVATELLGEAESNRRAA